MKSPSAKAPRNRYIVLSQWTGEALPWNPFDPADTAFPECAYVGGAIAAMEQDLGVHGLTFYITSNLRALPSYGDDVVAIVLSDEWCRIPHYTLDVRAVFKTYGTQLAMNWRVFARPTPYDLAAFAQDLVTTIRRAPSFVAAARAGARRIVRGQRLRWPIYDLPLGYFRQLALPFVPIAERHFDVYFAGSIQNKGAAARPLNRFTPKFISRANMLDRLRRISTRRPSLAIATALTRGFSQTTDDEVTQYSQTMMATKICLVPRGTSLETYRYFEGLRAGCVVVTEALPHRRYYDGSPAIRVRSWSELDELVPLLLADPARLEQLSRASRTWWAEHCSEEVVGSYLAARVRDGVFGSARSPSPADAMRS